MAPKRKIELVEGTNGNSNSWRDDRDYPPQQTQEIVYDDAQDMRQRKINLIEGVFRKAWVIQHSTTSTSIDEGTGVTRTSNKTNCEVDLESDHPIATDSNCAHCAKVVKIMYWVNALVDELEGPL